mmetsp:Transcript_97496/g.176116  ORF Transcript_97496/g.176116 Transcript_97496/m.176116 type:complete len:195 (-) Transcript_97496:220-804(-)
MAMWERLTAIAADVTSARGTLLIEAAVLPDGRPGNLRLRRLALEEEAVAFQVEGWDGDFTAFLADPYPAGESSVYGPDDFELQTTGTVVEVVAAVLQALADRPRGPSSDEEASPPTQSLCLDRSPSSKEDAAGGDDMTGIIEDSPLEPALQQDVDRARKVLGMDAVSIAQLSVEIWRVRLLVASGCSDMGNSGC